MLNNNQSANYRPDIDGLRAVAVLSVVFYHAGLTSLFGGGYVGVDIFFVISGYLISRIIYTKCRNSSFSFVDFYQRRIRRIAPALIGIILFSSVITCILYSPYDAKNFFSSMLSSLAMGSNFYFMSDSGYFTALAHTKPLLHLWSLGVEEQFYIFFPILVVYLVKHRINVLKSLQILFAVSLIGSIIFVFFNQNFTFYMFPTRAWELLAGSILAVKADRDYGKTSSNISGIAGIILILSSVIGFGYIQDLKFPGLAAVPAVLGSVLCIEVGRNSESIIYKVLSFRYLSFIGLISYSLYLWHWPVFVYAKYYSLKDINPVYINLGLLMPIFLLSYLSYKLIEQPFRQKRIFPKTKPLFAAYFITVILLSLFSEYGRRTGILQRFDPVVAKYYAYQNYYSPLPLHLFSVPGILGKHLYPFGESGKAPSVMILGDSHAKTLYETFDQLAKEKHLGGLLYYYDSPFFGVAKLDDLKNSIKRQKVFADYLVKNKVKSAVIAVRWTIRLQGRTSYEDPGSVKRITRYWILDNEGKPVQTEPGEALEFALNATAKKFRDLGIKTYIMLLVPEQSCNVPATAATLVRMNKNPEKEIFINKAEYNERQDSSTSIIKRVKAKNPEVEIINPADELCDDTACRGVIDGTPMYRDSNHLSNDGSFKMKKIFMPPIINALN